MNGLIKKIGNWPYVVAPSFAVSFLSVLVLILYLPTLHYGFVFDDYPTILEYPHMHNTDWSSMFFSSSRWIARVLQRLGFTIGGMQPIGFRLINLAVHLATGILVYVLINMLCSRLKQVWFKDHASLIALLTGALFLIHPVQTQTATYMTQMGTEGIAGFFTVLVGFFFVSTVFSKSFMGKAFWFAATLAIAYIGCGTKEIIVVLPGLLVLVDVLLIAQGDMLNFLRRLPLHLALAGVMFYGLGRVGMHVERVVREAPKVELPNNRGNIVTETFHETIKPNLYRWSQPKILFHYLSIFFWPVDLCFEYGTKIVKSPMAPDVLVPLLMWLVLAAILVWFFIRRTMLPLIFGISWFLAVMLPRAIAPSQELICDYKTYIASVGIMFVLACSVIYALERGAQFIKAGLRQQILTGGLAAFLCMMMISTYIRNLVWSDEQTFWADVVAKVPGRSRAYNNLAIAYLVKNDVKQAICLFEEAIRIDKNYGEPHVNLAVIYERLGDRKKSAQHHQLALMSGEMHPQLFYNLGLFNKNGGNFELAERAFRQAIEIKSFYPQARFELAQILQKKQRYGEVIHLCEETFQLQAQSSYPFMELYATALFEINDSKRAKEALMALDCRDPRIAFMLGCCLLDNGQTADSIKYFEIAYTDNRHNVSIAYNFGKALMQIEKYDRALDVLGRCNNVTDQMPFVPYFKARCLQGLGRKVETKELLVNIIQTTKHPVVRSNAQALLKTI
jgi:tetratricopeptide (TPR) repeat protein